MKIVYWKNVVSKKLWGLSPEIAALEFFGLNVPIEVTIKKVGVHKNSDNLNGISIKMYIVSIQNVNSMNNKYIYIYNFINSSSIKILKRFNMKTDF